MKASGARATERALLAEAERRLRDELFRTVRPLRVETAPPDGGPDILLSGGSHVFVVQVKGNAQYATVHRALDQLRRHAERAGARPLLAVPYMPPAAAALCEREGVSWFDLSGNADIKAPGVLIQVKGQPDRFRRRGRPTSVFAPKSSRVARCLLLAPGRRLRQQEIAQEAELDPGYVSRIVRRLVEARFVARASDGSLRAAAPRALLDAWRAENPFSREDVVRCHLPARGGEEALRRVAGLLRGARVPHAFTGLAAAWIHAPFAIFRVVSAYVDVPVTAELVASLGARAVESGANLWLVFPRDRGVFHGASEKDGMRRVHPVQAYVDLAGHPERAEEAAAHLREKALTWTLGDE